MLYQLSYAGLSSWRRGKAAASYKNIFPSGIIFVEPKAGIEPATYSLPWSCSTI